MIDFFRKKKWVAQTVPFTVVIGRVETINAQAITILEKDWDGNVLRCKGTVTVTDAGAWYAKGCLYIDTDVAAWTSGLYVNVWTTASCNFDLVTDAA